MKNQPHAGRSLPQALAKTWITVRGLQSAAMAELLPHNPPPSRVVVAMSGGVDSSVAAALLKQQGHEVIGCFLRLGTPEGVADSASDGEIDAACDTSAPRHRGCCSVGDAADARLVAAKLDVPLYVLNFRDAFDRVIDYFVAEYNAGRTPNPCVRCNDWLKFGRLLAYADSIGADYIASGHYARLAREPGTQRPVLLRGRDGEKDQSYVLFGLLSAVLGRMLLPVGDFTKPRIRALARELDLPVHDKPDSQEICFVPDDDYAGLIRRRNPAAVRPGRVLDAEGRTLGAHHGHQHYTVGQRRGLNLALGYPVYVVDRDAQANTITVAPPDHLAVTSLEADQVNWLIDVPCGPLTCMVQVRAHAQPVTGTVTATGDDVLRVDLDQPLRAVAPGQAVVCYLGDRLIGGGWICGTVRA